jgi:hypothetical protein
MKKFKAESLLTWAAIAFGVLLLYELIKALGAAKQSGQDFITSLLNALNNAVNDIGSIISSPFKALGLIGSGISNIESGLGNGASIISNLFSGSNFWWILALLALVFIIGPIGLFASPLIGLGIGAAILWSYLANRPNPAQGGIGTDGASIVYGGLTGTPGPSPTVQTNQIGYDGALSVPIPTSSAPSISNGFAASYSNADFNP